MSRGPHDHATFRAPQSNYARKLQHGDMLFIQRTLLSEAIEFRRALEDVRYRVLVAGKAMLPDGTVVTNKHMEELLRQYCYWDHMVRWRVRVVEQISTHLVPDRIGRAE